MIGIGLHRRKMLFDADFSPSDVAGLDLWQDASYGVTRDGSNNVSVWNDRRGAANHSFIQAVGANQPNWNANQINGYPTIDFNGATDFLKEVIANWLGGSNTGSVFIVCISSNNNVLENRFSTADEAVNTDNISFLKGNNAFKDAITIVSQLAANVNIVYGDIGLDDNAPHISTYESNGVAYTLKVDGTDDVVNEVIAGDDDGRWIGDIPNRDNIVIGGMERLALSFNISRFAEIIVYDAQLSTSDRAKVETYLSNKYSIII